MNRHEATVVRLLDGLSAASRDGGKTGGFRHAPSSNYSAKPVWRRA